MPTPRHPVHSAFALLCVLALGCGEAELPEHTPVVVAPLPEHLTLGNPSGATSDAADPDNYLISR